MRYGGKYVRFWHKADMQTVLTNVCFEVNNPHSGHPLGDGRNAHFGDAQGWLRNGSLKHSPKSFTEGSKNVRHLPRDLSI